MNAGDLMTEDPRTVSVNETLADAWSKLEDLDVRHLPVVSEEGDLVGMLSDRDLSGARGRDPLALDSQTPVTQAMGGGGPISVGLDADVHDVIELMLDQRVGAIPVVADERRLVGIISYVDVLRAIPKLVAEAVGEDVMEPIETGTRTGRRDRVSM